MFLAGRGAFPRDWCAGEGRGGAGLTPRAAAGPAVCHMSRQPLDLNVAWSSSYLSAVLACNQGSFLLGACGSCVQRWDRPLLGRSALL